MEKLTKRDEQKNVVPAITSQKEETDKAHELFWNMLHTSEDEINAMFNSGMFNSIAVGYGKIALEAMGMKQKVLQQFEQAMKCAFDLYDSQEARKVYLKY